MSTNKLARLAPLLKVIAWPVVVLVLVLIFMLLFRSSIALFINRWESFKMGDVEVKVESEQDKKFLENLLSEREAYIANLRMSVDSLAHMVDTLEKENYLLAFQLEENAKRLSQAEQQSTHELVEKTQDRVQNTSSKAKNLEQKAQSQYESLQAITKNDNFKQSLEEIKKGFDLLLNEEYDKALLSFGKADKFYPTVQESKKSLSVFMRENIEAYKTGDKVSRRRILAAILRDYKGRIPEDTRQTLEKIVLEEDT